MNRLQLFLALRKHRSLAEERAIDLERNKVAKWLIRVGEAFVVIYLLLGAIGFALAANDCRTLSAIEFLFCLSPFIILLDFFIRFIGQQTPSQIIKPYILLPIPKYTCIDFFIIGQMLNLSNLAWFVMIVPYCIMSVLFGYGFLPCVGILFVFWLMELCVSQFYLIVRTLINDTLLWWALPTGVILMALLPGCHFENTACIASDFSSFYDIGDFCLFYSGIGTGIESGNAWPYAVLIALTAVLFFINRKVQYGHIRAELSHTEKVVTVSRTDRLNFLDRLGETGIYLGLEIKTNLRNKNPRKSLIMGIGIIVLFSLIIIFTDVYDAYYMANFWCLYDFTIFGAMTLVGIMCYEGNFIDGLMVRRENILQILRAKYLFNCLMLLLPFILLLPTVISGKWSLLMVTSYGVFTAGFQFFLFFQLAVTNRTTRPLNTKFISKSGMENSSWQFIVEMFCLFVPVIFVSVIQALFNETIAYIVMLVIGVVFIATHRLWLRNIYNRFMKRRYGNMAGFRASR